MIRWVKPGKEQFLQFLAQLSYAVIGVQYLEWPKSGPFFLALLAGSFLIDGSLYLVFPSAGRRCFRFSLSPFIIASSTFLMVQGFQFAGYFIALVAALLSKHLFRAGGTHVFNPTNIGVLTLAMLTPGFGGAVADQWVGATYLVCTMAVVGCVVTFSAGKAWLSFSYLLGFFASALLRYFFFGKPWLTMSGTLLGVPALLFMFHMINDPRTTPATRTRQVLFGAAVGFMDVFLRTFEVLFAPLFALAIVSAVRGLSIEFLPYLRWRMGRLLAAGNN